MLRWMIDHIEGSNEADISNHLTALERVVAGLIEVEAPAAQRPRRKLQAVQALAQADVAEKPDAGQSSGTLPAKDNQETADVVLKPQNAKPQEAKPQEGGAGRSKRKPGQPVQRRQGPPAPRPTPAFASAWECSTS